VRLVANLTCCRAGTKMILQVCANCFVNIRVIRLLLWQNCLFDMLVDILSSASDVGLICECLRAVATALKFDNLTMVFLNCVCTKFIHDLSLREICVFDFYAL